MKLKQLKISSLAAVMMICSNANAALDDLAFLKQLVSISSGSADVEGVNRVQEKVAEQLKALGFQVKMIPPPQGQKTGNLLLAEKAAANSKFITLAAHADTVFEKLNPYVVSEDQKIIKGSGVSDDKGGIVVGVSALRSFIAHAKHSVRMIVTPSEEIGSDPFHAMMREYAADSVFIAGLEPARENGHIVKSRKGVRWYHVKVKGREAHAGVDHAAGINACDELAIRIDELRRLTNYKLGNTVNVGRIDGGKDKYNIVCGFAEAKIDMRFADPREAKKLFLKVETILKRKSKAEVTFDVITDEPTFAVLKEAKPFLDFYISQIKQLENRKIDADATGGVSDLNSMAREGLLMMDGLGPVGGGYHTAEEFVESASFATRSAALSALLKRVDETLP